MKCINGNCDANGIESDDNFCYKCGYWTARGYSFLKDDNNISMITNGQAFKQNNRLTTLIGLLIFTIIVFVGMLFIRGDNLFKPYSYLKKQIFNYTYGYNTSLIKADNKYSKEIINSYDEAINFIKKDFIKQDWLCLNSQDVDMIAYSVEEKYSIPSVSFCDMDLLEVKKIEEVIDRMYELFPNIKGALTNITITNASNNSEYIARFQPMYQFVNIDEDISTFNKINKTQILLNSYYFLNKDIINKPIEVVVGSSYYVDGATWESTIAHELGHYISFVTLLKKNNLDNITFITIDNYQEIELIIDEFNDGNYSLEILNKALNNYNNKYKTSMNVKEIASTISKYASSEDKNGNLIADETIAEAIHDYYLHGEDMKPTSRELISVIKELL